MATKDSLKACIDNEITVCSICLQTFDNPRSLPCLHTFCLGCVRDYCQRMAPCNQIPCPHCRRQFTLPTGGVTDLPHNFVIENLIQASRRQEYCEEHNRQILDKFCTECCLRICPLCEVLSHSNHNCISLSDAREHLIKRIDEEVGKVAATKDRIAQKKERLENMSDIFCVKSDKIIVDIKATGEEMKRLIDQRVDTLISKVKTVEKETLEKLRSMTEPLRSALLKAEKFSENSQHAKSHVKIKDVVDGFQKLSQTARELLECEMLPSAYQPPEILFVRNPNLASVLGNFHVGDFVVGQNVLKRKLSGTVAAEQQPSPKKMSGIGLELPMDPSVLGMATLGAELYVLRPKSKYLVECSIEVYSSIIYLLLRRLPAPALKTNPDMAACEHYRCLYISSCTAGCIHRLEVKGQTTTWPVPGGPFSVSVTTDHNVLVTCRASKKLKEFTTYGDLVNEINLSASRA